MLHSIDLSTISTDVFSQNIKISPLGIFNSNQNSYKIIPAATSPMILDDTLWSDLATEAKLVLSAMQKVSRWLCQTTNSKMASLLYSDLSSLESNAVYTSSHEPLGLATARFDLFFDGEDLKIIEVNTTIPAMQAYSDMTKKAYIDAWAAQHRPAGSKNQSSFFNVMQSNTLDLLTSLVDHYERSGGKAKKPCIAIVARQGDSQTAELLWLQKAWQEAGHECVLAHPEDVSISRGQLEVHKTRIDLIYRHIFAHRLAPQSDFAQACINSRHFRVFNPISAHLELKGLLAEVSRIATDKVQQTEAHLNADEIQAVLKRVPWSRIIIPGESLTPDTTVKSDLISWLKSNQNSVVLKSSSGYGGQQVIVGKFFLQPETQSALRIIMGRSDKDDITWHQFVDFCASNKDKAWIAQLRISGRKSAIKILAEDGVQEQEAYMDCSLFSNSGASFQPKGAASRFSIDPVVNIAKGGGLVPVLFKSEVDKMIHLKDR